MSRTELLHCEHTANTLQDSPFSLSSAKPEERILRQEKKKQNVTTFVVVSLFLVLTCVRGENNHDARINVQ